MTDQSRQKVWLMAEHAALRCETAVVALGPASQDQELAALLVNAAILRKTADDLFQSIAQRVSAGAPIGPLLH
jgi:hypothetical protein